LILSGESPAPEPGPEAELMTILARLFILVAIALLPALMIEGYN
jgi:hypothetical protein